MKNFILCVILALVAVGCAGTSENVAGTSEDAKSTIEEAVGTSEDAKSAIEANYQRQNELALKLACEDFKAYDYAKVQGKEADFSHKIVDYEKGLIAVAQKVWGDSAVNYKKTTCQKLKN